MKATQKQQAKDLYFGTHKTQKEIAAEVGINEKTLYLWIKKAAWDEHKQAALAAPAIIVDNLCFMLVELQRHIASRAEGVRFPKPHEADIMRKLINSIVKIKEYTSIGANMQLMADFSNYVTADDTFKKQLELYAEQYFKARKTNDRYPDHFAHGTQSPFATPELINEVKEEIETHFTPASQTPKMPDTIFVTSSGILDATVIKHAINQPVTTNTTAPTPRPSQEKFGHFLKRVNWSERPLRPHPVSASADSSITRPLSPQSSRKYMSLYPQPNKNLHKPAILSAAPANT